MRVLKTDGDNFEVSLSRDELWLLGQALNEVCNGVEIGEWEFQTRLGYERSVADGLMDELLKAAGSRQG